MYQPLLHEEQYHGDVVALSNMVPQGTSSIYQFTTIVYEVDGEMIHI